MVNFMIIFLLSAYLLYAGFLIYSATHRVWKTLSVFSKISLGPFLMFYPVDVVFNFIFGSVLFLERPWMYTFSGRLKGHLQDTNWRGKIARRLWFDLIIPFDPDHLS